MPNMGIDGSNGQALIEFNKYVSEDPRCQVIVLPIRDGISWIMAT
jgi:predicted O-methyltransferase YrrM